MKYLKKYNESLPPKDSLLDEVKFYIEDIFFPIKSDYDIKIEAFYYHVLRPEPGYKPFTRVTITRNYDEFALTDISHELEHLSRYMETLGFEKMKSYDKVIPFPIWVPNQVRASNSYNYRVQYIKRK
jgi:hypothetical protein